MTQIVDIIYDLISSDYNSVNSWFSTRLTEDKTPFYSSIDVRNSGAKIAPVDTNVFPAGFNHMNSQSQQQCSQYLPFSNKKVLIITENHDRNEGYTSNLVALSKLIQFRNNEVMLGNAQTSYIKTLHTQQCAINIHPLMLENGLLKTTNGFTPEIIIHNNDMIDGIPDIILKAQQQHMPSPQFGWCRRSKYDSVKIYNEIVNDFCKTFGLDPWLLSTYTARCNNISFRTNENIETIGYEVDVLIEQIHAKYQEYKISETPYVFIKADKGTYGMGIIMANGSTDVINANKKKRNAMYTTKGSTNINSVIIQEGVPTIDTFQNHTAEPLIYCINGHPLCFIYRYHENKNCYTNLNSPGSQFQDITHTASTTHIECWKLISKLSMFAVTIEKAHFTNSSDTDMLKLAQH